MRINLKRFTIGAILLATLSLLLQGCGSGSNGESLPKYMDKKQLSGTVSDLVTNQPLSGASVTAYPITNGVPNMSSPLSETVVSDNAGYYLLHIPVSYTGSILVEATAPPAKLASRLAKLVALTYTSAKIRTVLPGNIVMEAQLPPVMLNFATEAAVLFIELNLANQANLPTGFSSTGFTPENIRMALIDLETFFGVNFSTTALPKSTHDTTTTKAQQDLLVSIAGIQAVLATPNTTSTLLNIVTKIVTPAGLGAVASEITASIQAIAAQLILTGALPSGYTPSPAIIAAITGITNAPIPPVSLNDSEAPSVPINLSAIAASSSLVTLTWSASTDDNAVAGYLLYRATGTGAYMLIDAVGTAVTYSDITAAQGTTYSYKVVAFDAAHNFSAASSTVAVTTPVLVTPGDSQQYTLSGKVTYNGTGVAGVVLTIIGTGYGSTISDASGNYTFSQVVNGSYSISAALAGYAFTPASLSFSVTGSSITNLNFVSDKPGTVTAGITYPTGTIVGGITYPAGTVIGGVTYPTGTVIGGVTYPNGVVIGGVIYPSGTIVGGVAFPTGTVLGGFSFPTGLVTGVMTYPSGSYPFALTKDYVIISGRVTDLSALGLSGITISLFSGSGLVGSAVTGSFGYYTISAPAGTYTITPTDTVRGKTFTPITGFTISDVTTNPPAQNFTSTN